MTNPRSPGKLETALEFQTRLPLPSPCLPPLTPNLIRASCVRPTSPPPPPPPAVGSLQAVLGSRYLALSRSSINVSVDKEAGEHSSWVCGQGEEAKPWLVLKVSS